MRFCFDLDGTLCRTEGQDYVNAEPIEDRIERVNELYARGHHIIIATARGQSELLAVRAEILQMTRRQLARWQVRFHELHPKPFAHRYIDDRACHDSEFFG